MCVSDGGWVAPDFGSGVIRQRLLCKLLAHGDKPAVVFGPSGSGKSFLGAQFARQFDGVVVWLPADGVSLGAPEVSALVLRSLGSGVPKAASRRDGTSTNGDYIAEIVDATKTADCGEGVCVIIDDLSSDLGDNDLEFLHRLGVALWRAGARLIITTRSLDRWSPRVICDWCLIDGHDLALSVDEAEALAHGLGLELRFEDVRELCDVTAGHIALYAAMAIQASRYGLEVAGSRALSLDAWLDRVVGDMKGADLPALQLAAALKSGTERDLRILGVEEPGPALRRISAALPLVQVAATEARASNFWVHDIVDAYLVERGLTPPNPIRASVVALLTDHDEYTRACELLIRYDDDNLACDWLATHGAHAFDAGHVSALSRLLQSISVSALMSESATLVLWSRVCYETGRYEESLAKAKAARLLAEHDRDYAVVRGSIAQTLLALRYLGRQEEADALAAEVTTSQAAYVDDMLLAEALFCIGYGRVMRGDLCSAEQPFQAVLELCGDRPTPRHIARRRRTRFLSFLPSQRGTFSRAGVCWRG